MIEAVNSVVSNAQQARVTTDQVATLNSFAASQQAVESVSRGPVAPYISPFVSVDTRYNQAVLQIRDSDTGDVVRQFPSEPTLQQRQAEAARQAAQQAGLVAEQPSPLTQDSTFQATVIAQSSPAESNSTAGVAQAAIAALSAGAQSGQSATTTSVTA